MFLVISKAQRIVHFLRVPWTSHPSINGFNRPSDFAVCSIRRAGSSLGQMD